MKKEIKAEGAAAAPGILSQAIEANGLIFVSGQVHNTPNGKLIEGTVAEKLEQIMSNIATILKVTGLTLDNIVKTTIYVTGMAQMPELNEHYPSYFSAPLPAREAVCVKELPLGATIEISVIAVRNIA